jgi:hypothetical protein
MLALIGFLIVPCNYVTGLQILYYLNVYGRPILLNFMTDVYLKANGRANTDLFN